MKRFLQLLLITFLFVSCSSTKEVHTKEVTTAIEKEHVVTYKDTTFTVPASKASLRISKKQFETTNPSSVIDSTVFIPRVFTNKNGRAKATVTILKDTVIVVAECDSIALKAQIKQELIKEFKNTSATEISKVTKTRGVPLFNVITYCISFLVVGAVAGYFIKLFNLI